MRTLSSLVLVLSVGIASVALGGCEVTDCKTDEGKDAKCAESLKAFEATPEVVDKDYVAGASLTIDGVYGDITILPGDAGTVSTTFKPFNYRGNSQETDARREMDENLDRTVETDADGNITVTTGRHDATTGLGSHITVRIPPEFDGTLIVKNDGNGVLNQGLIDIQTVADATTLNVLNHGLDNCKVLAGEEGDDPIVSLLTDVDVRCEASILVRGVNDDVVVLGKSSPFHHDVIVEIASIGPDATGGQIEGPNSHVQVTFPLEGDYAVVANASGEGAHIAKVEAGNCDAPVDDETELQLDCGAGGPVYEIKASDEDPSDDEASRMNVYVR
jgi:hypothetical protein